MNNSTIKKFMPIPAFESEAQERAFWESHDSTDYVDWSKAGRVRFSNLKPSSKAISLRVPLDLLERIKIEANRRDVPYQSISLRVWTCWSGSKSRPTGEMSRTSSLIKIWLAEMVDSAIPRTAARGASPPGV